MANNLTRWSLCLLVLLSILPSVFGLYFYLEGSEQKCFTEELPKETMVIGNEQVIYTRKRSIKRIYGYEKASESAGIHKIQHGYGGDQATGGICASHYSAEEWSEEANRFVDNKEIAIEVIVDELPAGNRVFSQKLGRKGKFTFTSAESGEHGICLYASTTGWFSSTKIRVTFEMDITDVSDNAAETPESALSDLGRRVRELTHRVADIKREQSYLRDHEMDFRDKSEATNGHTVTWTIVQLIVLAVTCAWQMRHLRSFFESRKMI
ncbi:emp24p/erv25p- protein [Entomortierella lignicola]|nr:emp24p/erv25p- protein [Entomortierella lignicola]